LVFGGRVYIGGGSNLFCLDANGTGGTTTRYWVTPIGGTVDSSPTTDGVDDIFIASGNGYLKAIYTNGTEHWSSNINAGSSCSPAYWYGRVFCGGGTWTGGDNSVYCFDSDTGELIWSYKLESPPCSSPALAYGNVYIAGSGDVLGTGEYGNMYCLDAMGSGGTTTEIWRYNIGGSYSSAAVGYGRVYIGSNTREFFCLDAFGNGSGGITKYWTKTFNDWSHSSPIITPKYVFTGAGDGKFYCLNRTDASTIWSRKLGGDGLWGISSSPALAGNIILVTNEGDALYCIGAKEDLEPPKVVNTVPTINEKNVTSEAEIMIVFNKPVDISSISDTSILLKDSLDHMVACSVWSNSIGDTAYLKPDKLLQKSELYTVTVTTDIVDFVGYHLDGDKDGKDEGVGLDEYTFSFTTVVPYPPYIDPIPIQRPTEDILFVLNLSSYIKDPDTPKNELTILANSTYVVLKGLELHMIYPNGVYDDIINLSVGDTDFPTLEYMDIVVEVTTDNDPPEVTPIPKQMLTEDISYKLDISQYIFDQDTPDSNITLEDNSSYSEIDGLVINFTYPDGISSELVNLSVTDGQNKIFREIPMMISAVNDAPIIKELPPIEVDHDVPFLLSLEDQISDIDDPKQDLFIIVDSPYIKVDGHMLNLTYPDGTPGGAVNVKVSDGQLFDSTTLMVKTSSTDIDGNGDEKSDEGSGINILLAIILIIIIMVILIILKIKKKKGPGGNSNKDEREHSGIQNKAGKNNNDNEP
jgi:outer membrane protein assembly factor BamB